MGFELLATAAAHPPLPEDAPAANVLGGSGSKGLWWWSAGASLLSGEALLIVPHVPTVPPQFSGARRSVLWHS